jgi:hypothetical protein
MSYDPQCSRLEVFTTLMNKSKVLYPEVGSYIHVELKNNLCFGGQVLKNLDNNILIEYYSFSTRKADSKYISHIDIKTLFNVTDVVRKYFDSHSLDESHYYRSMGVCKYAIFYLLMQRYKFQRQDLVDFLLGLNFSTGIIFSSLDYLVSMNYLSPPVSGYYSLRLSK